MGTKRPAFTHATRDYVIDRARNHEGHVICACCAKPIRDDQQITINHLNSWEYIRQKTEKSPEFSAMDARLQERLLKDRFNNVNNLEPLHVACHRLVDQGIEFTPEEAERINRKTTSVKTKKDKHELTVPQPCETEIGTVFLLPDYAIPPPLETPVPVVHAASHYGRLLQHHVLNEEGMARLQEAPRELFEQYAVLTQARLHKVETRLAKLRDRSAATPQAQLLLRAAHDGLVGQRLALIGQQEALRDMDEARGRG